MTRADFYLLDIPFSELSHFACRLLQKIFQQKLSAYLYVASKAEASRWDALLWAFNDVSFLPHALYEKNLTLQVPIYVGHTTPNTPLDVLVNLTDTPPDFYSDFSRIVEIVPQEENLRAQARKKYQFYQQENCQLQMNTL